MQLAGNTFMNIAELGKNARARSKAAMVHIFQTTTKNYYCEIRTGFSDEH